MEPMLEWKVMHDGISGLLAKDYYRAVQFDPEKAPIPLNLHRDNLTNIEY
jgi:hypothetical protein